MGTGMGTGMGMARTEYRHKQCVAEISLFQVNSGMKLRKSSRICAYQVYNLLGRINDFSHKSYRAAATAGLVMGPRVAFGLGGTEGYGWGDGANHLPTEAFMILRGGGFCEKREPAHASTCCTEAAEELGTG